MLLHRPLHPTGRCGTVSEQLCSTRQNYNALAILAVPPSRPTGGACSTAVLDPALSAGAARKRPLLALLLLGSSGPKALPDTLLGVAGKGREQGSKAGLRAKAGRRLHLGAVPCLCHHPLTHADPSWLALGMQ